MGISAKPIGRTRKRLKWLSAFPRFLLVDQEWPIRYNQVGSPMPCPYPIVHPKIKLLIKDWVQIVFHNSGLPGIMKTFTNGSLLPPSRSVSGRSLQDTTVTTRFSFFLSFLLQTCLFTHFSVRCCWSLISSYPHLSSHIHLLLNSKSQWFICPHIFCFVLISISYNFKYLLCYI